MKGEMQPRGIRPDNWPAVGPEKFVINTPLSESRATEIAMGPDDEEEDEIPELTGADLELLDPEIAAPMMLDDEPVNISVTQAEREAEKIKTQEAKAAEKAEAQTRETEKRSQEAAERAEKLNKPTPLEALAKVDISEGDSQVTAETKKAALIEARKRALDAFEQGKREVA